MRAASYEISPTVGCIVELFRDLHICTRPHGQDEGFAITLNPVSIDPAGRKDSGRRG